MTIKDADDAVVKTLHEILVFIGKHEGLALMGFGSFKVRKKKARVGRNPRTGEKILIPEKYSISFHPGKVMKDMVNASSQLDRSNLAVARPTVSVGIPRKTRKRGAKPPVPAVLPEVIEEKTA
jgi:integration host factor subunit beta